MNWQEEVVEEAEAVEEVVGAEEIQTWINR
jgi:hypothetical protein